MSLAGGYRRRVLRVEERLPERADPAGVDRRDRRDHALQLVVELEEDLGEGQVVAQLDVPRVDVVHLLVLAAVGDAEGDHLAEDLEIPVQYKMIFENDSWQVFDVVIEGVSLIRNYRSSYGEIIRKNGYDGLFELMEQKVAAMLPAQPEGLQVNPVE